MITSFYIDDFETEVQINTDEGSLALGYLFDSPIDGLETPPTRVSSYSRAGEDGLIISNTFYDGRIITIPGHIFSRTSSGYLQLRRQLAYVCRLLKDTRGYPVSQKFRFTTIDNEEYFFYGRPQAKFGIGSAKLAAFLITIITPDPFLYKEGLNSSGLIAVPEPGGAIYPVVYPVIYAPSSGGGGDASNNGNAPTLPILTLRGEITNPYISNGATGEFIQLNLTMGASDEVVINMAEKTITLNGTSILDAKIGNSTWWSLIPGVNAISFSTSSSSDTGTLELEWYDAVLGV